MVVNGLGGVANLIRFIGFCALICGDSREVELKKMIPRSKGGECWGFDLDPVK